MPLYSKTLADAGFTAQPTRRLFGTISTCWIKTGKGDINVDETSGFWACEFATDNEGFGRYEDELRDFVARGYRHER